MPDDTIPRAIPFVIAPKHGRKPKAAEPRDTIQAMDAVRYCASLLEVIGDDEMESRRQANAVAMHGMAKLLQRAVSELTKEGA